MSAPDKAGSPELRIERPIRGKDTSAPAKPSRLWLWFVAAFIIQAAAWTAWFVIASKNKVQEVPLVTAPDKQS